jgi:cytoskeletal protein RodZ
MCAMTKKRGLAGLIGFLLLFLLLFTGCNTAVDTNSDQTTTSATTDADEGEVDNNTDGSKGTTKKTNKKTTKKTSKTNGKATSKTSGKNTTKGTVGKNTTKTNATTATRPDDYEPHYIANADGTFTEGNTGVVFLDDPCASTSLSAKECLLFDRGRKVFVDKTHPDVFKDEARFRRNDATSASDWWFSYYLSRGISECAIISYTQENDAGVLIQTFDVYVSPDNSRWTKVDLSYNTKEDKNLGNGWYMRTYRVTGLSKSNKYLKVQFAAVEDGAQFYVPNIGRVRINDIYNMQEFDRYMSESGTQITKNPTATTTKTTTTTKTPTTTHKHSYSKKTVSATCTRRGYTQYTCACGDTYKADYVRVEHTYSNGKCTSCGKSVKETTGFSQYEVSYYWGPHGDNMINEG